MDELLSLISARVAPGVTISADTPLISTGLIDSFTITSLVVALETHFNVSIDPGDIGVDNFDTPAQMLALLSTRR